MRDRSCGKRTAPIFQRLCQEKLVVLFKANSFVGTDLFNAKFLSDQIHLEPNFTPELGFCRADISDHFGPVFFGVVRAIDTQTVGTFGDKIVNKARTISRSGRECDHDICRAAIAVFTEQQFFLFGNAGLAFRKCCRARVRLIDISGNRGERADNSIEGCAHM